MVTDRTVSTCVCDGCGKTLTDSGIRLNNGTYQEEWIRSNGLDICFACANEIFDKFIIDSIPKETLEEHLKSVRSYRSFLIPTMQFNMPVVGTDESFNLDVTKTIPIT